MILDKILKIRMRDYTDLEYFEKITQYLPIKDKSKKDIIFCNFSIPDVYNILKIENNLEYIFLYLLFPYKYFLSEIDEIKWRVTLMKNINFVFKNVPIEIYNKFTLKFFNYVFLMNFHLSYTNLNNKRVLQMLNTLYLKNTKLFYKNVCNKKFVEREKIKLGIVCNHIFESSKPVCKDRSIVALNFDKKIFDVFFITNLPEDKVKKSILKNEKIIICNVNNGLNSILNNKFDILFYPEIGMDMFTFRCGIHRLAPVQIATWGHSETTGMTSMDYYISSKYFNNKSDNKYFSEQLILLDSFGTYYRPMKPLINNDDESIDIYKKFNIPKHMTIYNSLQTPRKICRHEFLNMVLQILVKNKNSVFLTMYYTIPEKNFILKILDSVKDRIRLTGWQTNKKVYQKILLSSTILLDPYPFGSLNTSLDAFNFNKVILTLPSKKINGNFCAGFYKKMGIDELIAKSEKDYIEKALKLSDDIEYRKDLENQIKNKKHVLFYEKKSVKEYNDVFKNLYMIHSKKKFQETEEIKLKFNRQMMLINKSNNMRFKHYLTKKGDEVYIDNYNLVWKIKNNKLISRGLSFGNTVYNQTEIFSLSKYLSNVFIPYPLIIPVFDKNYKQNVVDIRPKGSEVITWMIAVYNRKHTVKETIDSLLNQSNSNWKCVICDDGSTDGSYDYIRDYIKDDNRFKLFRKKNSGIVKTTKFMLEKTETDVVATLDSDDVLEINANEILMNRYRKERCLAIYTAYTVCNKDLKKIKVIIPEIKQSLLKSSSLEHIRSWRKNCTPHNSFPDYLKVTAEDQDLSYRFEEISLKYILIEKTPLIKFRRTEVSIMRNKDSNIGARRDHYVSKIAALNRRKFRLMEKNKKNTKNN